MKIIQKPEQIQSIVKKFKQQKKSIGFVPTMGALHRGHISLIRRARRENDIVVVSIFVNPAQFGPAEDFAKYPRPFEKDAAICRKEGVNLIFAPRPQDMYPKNYLTYITVEKLSDIMCGAFRPGHFRGVATVVAKLFNIVQLDRAYFGLKDYQQSVVIKKMASDLNFPVKIVACPTVREKSGLALSSRNQYLSGEERKRALSLSRSLQRVKNLVKLKKLRTPGSIIEKIKNDLSGYFDRLDYVEVRNAETLEKVEKIDGRIVIAAAGFIGKTRLIDNVVV